MTDTGETKNTDRELWRGPDTGNGDYYADSIHVTEGGGIGINVGGTVYVRPLKVWHALAAAPAPVPTWQPIESAPKDKFKVCSQTFILGRRSEGLGAG